VASPRSSVPRACGWLGQVVNPGVFALPTMRFVSPCLQFIKGHTMLWPTGAQGLSMVILLCGPLAVPLSLTLPGIVPRLQIDRKVRVAEFTLMNSPAPPTRFIHVMKP